VYRLMLAWDAVADAITMTEAQLRRYGRNGCSLQDVRRLMALTPAEAQKLGIPEEVTVRKEKPKDAL
jgi:hypothetical protein